MDGGVAPDGYDPSLFHTPGVGRRTPYDLLAALVPGALRADRGGVVMMPSVHGWDERHGGLTDDQLATQRVLLAVGTHAAPTAVAPGFLMAMSS